MSGKSVETKTFRTGGQQMLRRTLGLTILVFSLMHPTLTIGRAYAQTLPRPQITRLSMDNKSIGPNTALLTVEVAQPPKNGIPIQILLGTDPNGSNLKPSPAQILGTTKTNNTQVSSLYLLNLKPETIYYFRVVLGDSAPIATSAIQSFTTFLDPQTVRNRQHFIPSGYWAAYGRAPSNDEINRWAFVQVRVNGFVHNDPGHPTPYELVSSNLVRAYPNSLDNEQAFVTILLRMLKTPEGAPEATRVVHQIFSVNEILKAQPAAGQVEQPWVNWVRGVIDSPKGSGFHPYNTLKSLIDTWATNLNGACNRVFGRPAGIADFAAWMKVAANDDPPLTQNQWVGILQKYLMTELQPFNEGKAAIRRAFAAALNDPSLNAIHDLSLPSDDSGRTMTYWLKRLRSEAVMYQSLVQEVVSFIQKWHFQIGGNDGTKIAMVNLIVNNRLLPPTYTTQKVDFHFWNLIGTANDGSPNDIVLKVCDGGGLRTWSIDNSSWQPSTPPPVMTTSGFPDNGTKRLDYYREWKVDGDGVGMDLGCGGVPVGNACPDSQRKFRFDPNDQQTCQPPTK